MVWKWQPMQRYAFDGRPGVTFHLGFLRPMSTLRGARLFQDLQAPDRAAGGWRFVRTAATVAILGFAWLPVAARAETPVRSLELKPGQALTFAVIVTGGRAALGPGRLTKPGPYGPNDGEVSVSVVRQGLSPYAALTVTEKTPEPVDFVVTGLIGDIKIDEIVVCGRLDAPVTTRIASGVWRVSLNSFAVRPGGEASPAAGEGGLGCPR